MKIVLGLFLSLFVLFAQELRVGSENAYKPFAYVDEKGNATGFDNEVMKIVASYITRGYFRIRACSLECDF